MARSLRGRGRMRPDAGPETEAASLVPPRDAQRPSSCGAARNVLASRLSPRTERHVESIVRHCAGRRSRSDGSESCVRHELPRPRIGTISTSFRASCHMATYRTF